MARSLQSRRDLGNLGEISAISPRSRRDLESKKHHGEISARSRQSRRDLVNLAEISSISARSRRSRRDLGKNFARVVLHLRNLPQPSSKTPGIPQNLDFWVFCQPIDSCTASGLHLIKMLWQCHQTSENSINLNMRMPEHKVIGLYCHTLKI